MTIQQQYQQTKVLAGPLNSTPVVAGVEITTDEAGRFNLNALHRASGGEKKNGPSYWLSLETTKELIEALGEKLGDTEIPVSVIRGGLTQGTFAHELLAISYAGWISPAFQLQVNQVFLDYRTGKLASQPQLPTNFVEALEYLLQSERDKEQIRAQRDEAIRTKGCIASSREASVMAQLGHAKRQVDALKERLGIGDQHKSIKGAGLETLYLDANGHRRQTATRLKKLAHEMGVVAQIIDIEDPNYGTVKAYPIEVIARFKQEMAQ